MKKVIILGAGVYQVPLITCARSMGIHTIVASIRGDYPGFAVADQVAFIDTTDREAVLHLARQENIDGICTTGTDVAIRTLGYVCDSLNLPGLSYEAALAFTDKWLMKKLLHDAGLTTPSHYVVRSLGECCRAFESLTKPVIVKAVDSSGSRGIVKADNISMIEDAYNSVQNATKKDYCIVEEFIEGEEFGAQAFVYQGELLFVLPHGDFVFCSDTGVPIGHYAPIARQESIQERMLPQIKRLAKEAKLDTCALNIDCIAKDNTVYFLEVGARAGATCLVELVSLYYNFNYYKHIINCCMGLPVDFNPSGFTPNASRLLFSHTTGTIRSISDANDKHPDIIDISFDYKTGDAVRKFHTGPDRIGHVITKGATLDEALSLLNSTLGKIAVEIT